MRESGGGRWLRGAGTVRAAEARTGRDQLRDSLLSMPDATGTRPPLPDANQRPVLPHSPHEDVYLTEPG